MQVSPTLVRGLIELLPHPVSTLFETCGLPALEGGILAYQTHLEETETTSKRQLSKRSMALFTSAKTPTAG
jgi:hypothetical protein